MKQHVLVVMIALSLAAAGCGDDGGPGPSGSTTGSDAGGGGGGGDGGGGGGGGSDAGSGGGGGPAPEVTIAIAESCDPVDPCGGAILGSWQYSSGCVEASFDAIFERCPTATLSDEVARARGTVTVSDSEVVQEGTVRASATLHLPAECSYGMCDVIEGTLAGAVDRIDCVPSGSGCDCDIETTDTIYRSGGYTIDGGILTTEEGYRYAFCVDGSTMRYQPLDGEEDATYVLSRR